MKGARVLVVEDEFLLACSLADDVESLGFVVVGPYADLPRAREAARTEPFDVALLDVNINGEMVFPLAEDLLARGVPFLLMTGYGVQDLPEKFRTLPRLTKPYDPAALSLAMRRIVPEAPGS